MSTRVTTTALFILDTDDPMRVEVAAGANPDKHHLRFHSDGSGVSFCGTLTELRDLITRVVGALQDESLLCDSHEGED